VGIGLGLIGSLSPAHTDSINLGTIMEILTTTETVNGR
jgi:hypothetical protein